MKFHLASDHAGFFLKEALKKFMEKQELEYIDYGTNSPDSVDYPDYVHKLMNSFLKVAEKEFAILICGSGNGICMTANKYPGIRGALVWNEELALLAKKHNNANVLCLPGRFVSVNQAEKILLAFINAEFEGGRHKQRIQKINIQAV